MIYYKDNLSGSIYAFDTEDDRQIYGNSSLVEISKQDVEEINREKDSELVPLQITKAQGKAALIRAGLWQGAVNFVDSISDPVEKAVAEVALNDTTHWQRSSQFLNSAAEALGLTDDKLDKLFVEASKIEL